MTPRIRFGWQPKQRQLYDLVEKSKATRIGFGGARGGSKSHAGRQIILARRLKYPGTKALIIRRTWKEVRENCVEPMFRNWPITRKWMHHESHTLRLPNGSSIVFGYAEHKGDIYDFRGLEFADILVEEATHFNEDELKELETCNRWTGDSSIVAKTIYTMNPGNVGHAYIKRVLVDGEYVGNEQPDQWVFVQAYGWDNIEWSIAGLRADRGVDAAQYDQLGDADKRQLNRACEQVYYKAWTEQQRFEFFVQRSDYGRSLWAFPDDLRAAHLFGEWDSFVGQFFSEFSKREHVCKPFPIPSYWERFAAFDWGFTSPACQLWFAVNGEGQVFAYREMYVTGKDTPWLGAESVKRTQDEQLRYKVGDPSCWDPTRGPSIAEVMANNGWAMLQAEHDRKNGWARVREYLSYERSETGELIRPPKLQIFEGDGKAWGCPNLIKTLPALVHDEHDVEDCNSKGEDHAPDALRYGLMTRPKLSIVPLDVLPSEYRDAQIRAEHDERSGQRSGYEGPLD